MVYLLRKSLRRDEFFTGIPNTDLDDDTWAGLNADQRQQVIDSGLWELSGLDETDEQREERLAAVRAREQAEIEANDRINQADPLEHLHRAPGLESAYQSEGPRPTDMVRTAEAATTIEPTVPTDMVRTAEAANLDRAQAAAGDQPGTPGEADAATGPSTPPANASPDAPATEQPREGAPADDPGATGVPEPSPASIEAATGTPVPPEERPVGDAGPFGTLSPTNDVSDTPRVPSTTQGAGSDAAPETPPAEEPPAPTE